MGKPVSNQELMSRKLRLADARLSTVSDLSNLFALFFTLAAVDLNINPGDASPGLIIAFIVITSFLVSCTVLIKIAIMYITPRLETALLMSRYNIKEFDHFLHEEVARSMENLWITSTLAIFTLFGTNFIMIIWIKFKNFSTTSTTAATAIMSPVIICAIGFAAVAYFNMKKRYRKSFLNEDVIVCRETAKMHYSKHAQPNHNNSHAVNSKWDVVKAHVHKLNDNSHHKPHIV